MNAGLKNCFFVFRALAKISLFWGNNCEHTSIVCFFMLMHSFACKLYKHLVRRKYREPETKWHKYSRARENIYSLKCIVSVINQNRLVLRWTRVQFFTMHIFAAHPLDRGTDPTSHWRLSPWYALCTRIYWTITFPLHFRLIYFWILRAEESINAKSLWSTPSLRYSLSYSNCLPLIFYKFAWGPQRGRKSGTLNISWWYTRRRRV